MLIDSYEKLEQLIEPPSASIRSMGSSTNLSIQTSQTAIMTKSEGEVITDVTVLAEKIKERALRSDA